MTELSVVSGSWPIPAARVPMLNSFGDGTKVCGCQMLNLGVGCAFRSG